MGKGAHQDLRFSEVDREYAGVKVHIVLDLDGGSRRDVSTGEPILDSLLVALAHEAGFDLGVSVEAESIADVQDIAEAVGSTLGRALATALEGSDEVVGTGSAAVPQGTDAVMAVVDVLHGPATVWLVPFSRDEMGGLPTQAISQFAVALAATAGATVHLTRPHGENDRHAAQAAFRALGRALGGAVQRRPQPGGLPR